MNIELADKIISGATYWPRLASWQSLTRSRIPNQLTSPTYMFFTQGKIKSKCRATWIWRSSDICHWVIDWWTPLTFRTSKLWQRLLLKISSKGGMVSRSKSISKLRNSGQFSAIILKFDKEINVRLGLRAFGHGNNPKCFSFGQDRRLRASLFFSILQPIKINVCISWRSANGIKNFEFRCVMSFEAIVRIFRDCDHLEATIVIEGVRSSASCSSSESLWTRLIRGYNWIDFRHGESMKPRRCWMRKKEPVTCRLSRASKDLRPPLWLFEFSGAWAGWDAGLLATRVRFSRNGKVPRTSHKLKSAMKTTSESSRDRSCLKWTRDFFKMSTDIRPSQRTIRVSIWGKLERVVKNGPTTLSSKPLKW